MNKTKLKTTISGGSGKIITLLFVVLSTILIKSGISLKSGDSYKIGNTTLLQESQFDLDNIKLDGNTISATNTDGNLIVTANGTGKVFLGHSFAVDSTGKTGIGTTSPREALQLDHNLNLMFVQTNTSYGGIIWKQPSLTYTGSVAK